MIVWIAECGYEDWLMDFSRLERCMLDGEVVVIPLLSVDVDIAFT